MKVSEEWWNNNKIWYEQKPLTNEYTKDLLTLEQLEQYINESKTRTHH